MFVVFLVDTKRSFYYSMEKWFPILHFFWEKTDHTITLSFSFSPIFQVFFGPKCMDILWDLYTGLQWTILDSRFGCSSLIRNNELKQRNPNNNPLNTPNGNACRDLGLAWAWFWSMYGTSIEFSFGLCVSKSDPSINLCITLYLEVFMDQVKLSWSLHKPGPFFFRIQPIAPEVRRRPNPLTK